MGHTNSGIDLLSKALGGGVLGEFGVATASSTTTLTTNSGVTHATNDLAGQIVVSGTATVCNCYGVVVSNTSGTNTVLTVDRWSVPATPGGAAATTPISTAPYGILPGGSPAWFMGLTATNTAFIATDTTLASEITTASGGLIRKICPYAHTTSTNTATLTPVFTANGSDSLPVTIAAIGTMNCLTGTTCVMPYHTVLGTTATLSLSGDNLTVTQTLTIS